MSEYLYVKGGGVLEGKSVIHGAKNAVLPLLAAGLMSENGITVNDCPYISDVDTMCRLLIDIGLKIKRDGRKISVFGSPITTKIPPSHAKNMRSSMYMLGAMIARCKEVTLPLPGGCVIGARPLDIHLDGLKKMGVNVEIVNDNIYCHANTLHGADIIMKYPSVGATENLMMVASVASGKTTLINCAREPEIISLAHALRAMGARIYGDGTSVIYIEGVDKLFGSTITPIKDRIVAGTLVCAGALCGGDVIIEGGNINHIMPLKHLLENKTCDISGDEYHVRVRSRGYLRAFDVTSAPYPLFATDLQPQLLACACFSDGISNIVESVFDRRFAHAIELKKLGFDIRLNDNSCKVVGCNSHAFDMGRIRGGNLYAKDLRGGAGLLCATLKIRGDSKIFGVEYIDRGYEEIENMFCVLGAFVQRKIE